jgi:hypothetical protein
MLLGIHLYLPLILFKDDTQTVLRRKVMVKKSIAPSFLLIFSVLLSACGSADAAIATGIAQTQQISDLETAAAAPDDTATPEPSATAVATSEGQTGSQGVTTNQDVNMRAGDSTAYGVMTVIPGGEVLQITGINAAGTWYQVLYHNVTGWVSIDFTTGTPPANLPIATPPPAPAATATKQQTDYDDFFLELDYSDDQNREVSGEVFGNLPSRITIRVEGMSGNDEGEIDIAFQCDTSEPENVDITSSGASDNTICNNNWSYDVDADHDTVTIFVELDGGGSVEWTCIANVSPN